MENELLVLWTGRQMNDNMKIILTTKLMEHIQPNSTESVFFIRSNSNKKIQTLYFFLHKKNT